MSMAIPIVRNLRFPLNAVPRDWHGGRRAVSRFFDNLSVFFPAGERFFVVSVRAHRRHVEDPQLAREADAFSAQEGFHSREHVRYNERLRAHGYPVQAMERRVERLLGRVSRRLPVRAQLAATCALEHFTAILSHRLLADPRVTGGMHPTMAALWRWHAIEETEHKSVAFDVYRAAGGPYLERIAIMLAASVVFWAKVLEHQVRLQRADGTLFSLREWGDLAKFLFGKPGVLRRALPHYLSYFRPGFHPWQHDNRAIMDHQLRELQAVREIEARQ
jgi:predicted metal-dependent hydrolase